MKILSMALLLLVSVFAVSAFAYEILEDSATGYGHAWQLECDAGRIENVYYTTQTGLFAVDTGESFATFEQAARAVCGE